MVKALYNYGERVQKSVWACDVDAEMAIRLQRRLDKLDIATGMIHMWQAKAHPWKSGALDTPPRPWAHCL